MAAVKQPNSIFNQSVVGYEILTFEDGLVAIDQSEPDTVESVVIDWRQIPDLIKRLQDAHMACCKHFDG